MAEVDHFGEVVEVGVAVGAGLDAPDAGVEAFGERVGQAEEDGVENAVEVAGDAAGEGDEAADPAAFRGGDPPFQVAGGVLRVDVAVEVTQVPYVLVLTYSVGGYARGSGSRSICSIWFYKFSRKTGAQAAITATTWSTRIKIACRGSCGKYLIAKNATPITSRTSQI
jgi:hypothetical protein